MFLETAVFPACPSFGFVAQADFSTVVVRFSGGAEVRQRNWARPLKRFTITIGPREEQEVEAVLSLYYAAGGQASGFRVCDPTDYLSCGLRETPTAQDQPLMPRGTSPETWQLVKRYHFAGTWQDRHIAKPVPGTISVANELGAAQPPDRWTLDTATGVLTPEPSFVGTPTTWGGEFDVPVRFDSEFPQEIVDEEIQSVTLQLVELRL